MQQYSGACEPEQHPVWGLEPLWHLQTLAESVSNLNSERSKSLLSRISSGRMGWKEIEGWTSGEQKKKISGA